MTARLDDPRDNREAPLVTAAGRKDRARTWRELAVFALLAYGGIWAVAAWIAKAGANVEGTGSALALLGIYSASAAGLISALLSAVGRGWRISFAGPFSGGRRCVLTCSRWLAFRRWC